MLRKGLIAMVLSVFAVLGGLAVVAGDEEVAAEGRFVKKSKSISGGFVIKKQGERYVLELTEDFKTKSGPDLQILFSPKTLSALNGKNATNKALTITLLKKTRGSQTYTLPADFDPTRYKSVLIHCVKYAVLWGGGEL